MFSGRSLFEEYKILKNVKPRVSRIEIAKHALNFSIAHFTIFSATERENLHGHNFQVQCEILAPVLENGLTFDYGIIKTAVRELCDFLDEKTILPENSPYLKLEQEGDYTVAIFDGERLPFLHRDVMTLPVRNTTVEELSWYILEHLLESQDLKDRGLMEMTVKVSSSPGQTGCSTWVAS